MSIRVVVAGDHQLVLEAFAETLNGTDGLDVVGLATSYEAVMPAVERHRPTVLLLGESTMGGKALRAATDVRSAHPWCGVALMVGAATPAVVDRAVAAGALGVVPKNARLPQLVTTLMGVAGGCLTVDPALLRPAVAGETALSVREMDVLRLTAGGASVKEIAGELYLAAGTVRNLTSAAIKKLGGRNRFDAARIASEHGWL
ncbi:response regulator transcription factor [Streptomyces pristinaespiralis]|jgi:two-component system response regulator DesR|uniref:Two component transcriptional regulator n=2 Tax=Streptomyces pristinaespiralis TaxID=38300 RepID=B5HGN8_STRE2|nr:MULTISPECIES: response regulator transcription factor [Streptomyces]ALC20237.1 two component transcriptional regulator [Streptomyces pristinaespiralis]EDY65999.1 two component transcriptional regulator [Streptomyces pristinaespiralis ATCC 25486]MDQ0845686.1 two-component system response regulator DesR [Streptomyces sp. V1I6]QIP84155.1 response regulator transcription factor [Streptomyces sp. Tu 2975]QMU16884.1 response regulator transcription factor [Streptomyces pristinaespiralis]